MLLNLVIFLLKVALWNIKYAENLSYTKKPLKDFLMILKFTKVFSYLYVLLKSHSIQSTNNKIHIKVYTIMCKHTWILSSLPCSKKQNT